jgi:hypothetical protein
MYYDTNLANNTLDSDTIERLHRLGVGWSSSLPVIQELNVNSINVVTLFMGGAAYELDQSGLPVNNVNQSNLLGYDLVDKRIFHSSALAYSDYTNPLDASDIDALKLKYTDVSDESASRSFYEMVFTNNSRLYFREDGKLMMQQDPSGLNQIWYFYDSQARLSVVVDSIGREIDFSYDLNGNLSQISWDVEIWEEGGATGRQQVTHTRTVNYEYTDTALFPGIESASGTVIDYIQPYVLKRVINTLGHVTEYDYQEGAAEFSFNSTQSRWTNYYLKLTDIYNLFTDASNYLNGRHFEYEVPAKGMYLDLFYTGFREFYKISRQYVTNRHQEILHDTYYHYYDDGENGNSNTYSAIIEKGNVTTTYVYNNQSDIRKKDTLASILVTTQDGFEQLEEFTYDSNRAISLNALFRFGQKIYEEQFFHNDKGQKETIIDKNSITTRYKYDAKFGIPIQIDTIFTNRFGPQVYTSITEIDDITGSSFTRKNSCR